MKSARRIVYYDRTDPYEYSYSAVGTWGDYNPQGHRTFRRLDGSPDLHLFDDEVDSDVEVSYVRQ